MNNVIVGIDTGKTSAIACVDLNGRAVYTATMRFANARWFVDSIKAAGLPVIIASDKKKANDAVTKLAAIFDAVLFTPKEDIKVRKKQEYSNLRKVKNVHERDALSAAMAAYKHYSNKLMQVERIAREGDAEDIDKIKGMVIKKYSINEALRNLKAGRFVR